MALNQSRIQKIRHVLALLAIYRNLNMPGWKPILGVARQDRLDRLREKGRSVGLYNNKFLMGIVKGAMWTAMVKIKLHTLHYEYEYKII